MDEVREFTVGEDEEEEVETESQEAEEEEVMIGGGEEEEEAETENDEDESDSEDEEDESEEEEEEEEEENSKREISANTEEIVSSIRDENAEWDLTEIEGLFCPICMDAWTNGGDHHICCLPCGHLFGFSCISKWLTRNRNSAKCPLCNRNSTLKDVRKLFPPRIAVVDEESHKMIRFLENKCAALEKEGADLRRKASAEQQRREAESQQNLELFLKYFKMRYGDVGDSIDMLMVAFHSFLKITSAF